MTFFNVIATPGLGKINHPLNKSEISYGQANLSINANPLNGNLFVKDFVQTFIEQGFQFNVGYQYNSQSESPWRLNQGKLIGSIQGEPNEEDSFVKVEDADGHIATYTYDLIRNCYVNLSETGSASTLTYSSKGQWSGWNPLSNIKETYNQNHQLVKITDSFGNHLTYAYDSSNRLSSISGLSGLTVVIEYDLQTTTIYSLNEGKKQKTAHYEFDEKNQLKKTTIPINADENYEINYAYEDSSNLLKSITQSDQTQVNFTYEMHDDAYRLSALKNGVDINYSLQYEGNKTHLTSPLGNKETFTLNEFGLLKQHAHHDQEQDYTYDDVQRLKTIEYQDGSFQKFSYDTLGCYAEVTDRSNEKTLFKRDASNGLLLCETQVLSDANPVKHLNTFYVYNDEKALVFKIEPNGAVHAFDYDDKGNCIRQKVYLDALFDLSNLTKADDILSNDVKKWCEQQNKAAIALSEWTYTKHGKKESETRYATIDKEGNGILDEFTAYHQYEWNNHGDMLTQKTRLDTQTTVMQSVSYDGLTRPTQETNVIGQITTHTYKENQHLKTFIPTGLVTTTTWNTGGDVIQKQELSGKLSQNTTHTYDKAGRVCIIEKENGSKDYLVYDEYGRVLFAIDSRLCVTQSGYDINNRLIHTSRYAQPLLEIDEAALKEGTWEPTATGQCCIESTLYNDSGLVVGSINGDDFVTEHTYDLVGNLIQTIEYAKPLKKRGDLDSLEIEKSDLDRIHRFYFNEAKHLIGEQTPTEQVIVYKRNSQGELKHKITSLGAFPEVKDWNEKVISQEILTIPHKTESFTVNALGQCQEHTNSENITTTHTRDAGGRLIKTSCCDKTEMFAWDAMDRLLKESQSSGLEVTKSYAPCGKIASVEQIDTLAKDAPPRNTYVRYDGFGEVTHELLPRVALSLSDPAFAQNKALVEDLWQNKSIQHQYNTAGLKTSTRDELGNISYYYYNLAHELCFTISPTGRINEYTYDTVFHKQVSTRDYAVCLEKTKLDSLDGGLLTSELIKLFDSKKTVKDAIEYVEFNKRGLIALKTDAEQFTTKKKYDAFGNIEQTKQQIDKDNKLVCQMEYDKASRLVEKSTDVDGINATETWKYKDEENVIIYTDSNKGIQETHHDKLNRKTKIIDALKREETFVWDGLSRLESTTDALHNTTTFSHENQGRKVTKTGPLSQSIIEKNAFGEMVLEQDADGNVWQTTHDVDGQLKTQIDPDGYPYNYDYNEAGWLCKVTDPLGKITRYEHDKSGHIEKQIEEGLNEKRVQTFQRDSAGRELLRTDANGIKTQTIYDNRGLKTDKIIDTDNLALHTHSEYNGLGKLTQESIKDSHYPDPVTTQIVRDTLGRLSGKIVDPEGLNLRTQKLLDAQNNCVAIIDPNNHTSRSCYDAANQERYRIDPMGGVIEMRYDKKGRCIKERHYVTSLNLKSIDDFTLSNIETLISKTDEDKVFYYAYDANDNRIASLNEKLMLTKTLYNAHGKKTHEVCYATPMTKTEFFSNFTVANQKDRQSAWYYDKRGNERFAINGEGIVTEQCWNEKGWLIETRAYAKPYFDYTNCPNRETLKHADDRTTHYIHDAFGRITFEINGEGYVTEYGYDNGDKPTTTWFYPDKIKLPLVITLTSIRELVTKEDSTPCIQVKYDGASRRIEAIDQLKYKEEFKLDALGNLREYIDKGGDSWTYTIDNAGRKIEETSPPVEVTSVTTDGQLINPTGKQRIIKKTEYLGDMLRITEAYGTADARTLELHQNACNKTIKTVQQNVSVNDKTKIWANQHIDILDNKHVFIENYQGEQQSHRLSPKLSSEPSRNRKHHEISKTLKTQTVYNAFKKPIVSTDEAGNLKLNVYEGDNLRYEIDQEGFVNAYEYNVFGKVVKFTRFANAIEVDLKPFAQSGIPLSIVRKAIKISDLDRSVSFEFDNANRPTKTTQDAIFVYIPQANGEPHHGEYSPVIINEYNAFGEVPCTRELIDPISAQWKVTRTWFDKAGFVKAEVDGLNYLTYFTLDKSGNRLHEIECAKQLELVIESNTSYEDLIQACKSDAKDRLYTNVFNARDELEQTIQHEVDLYCPELDDCGIINVSQKGKQFIEHFFTYNAKGKPTSETLPNGANTITQYDARNLPILKTKPSRSLESGPATPVTTLGYNAFGQPTRTTHHKNPYEGQKYLTLSNEDQTHLAGYDSRGLQVVAADPEGAIHYQSFTETKKLASKWIWVTGWGANSTLVQRLHHTNSNYDKRGLEIKRCDSIEKGESIITDTRFNAFGEKVAEGYGDGDYPVYWLRDKTGAVWNTNEQKGVPTITINDARGLNTLTLRSRTRSLKEITSNSKLQTIIDLDYRELQRLELCLDVNGTIEEQRLPAFSSLKIDAPEPYLTETSCGSLYPEFGLVSLSWPHPDVAGLEAEVSIWPKGSDATQAKKLEIKTNEARCGVDVSDFVTDDYQYQIDFYYRDPQSKYRDGLPRYRAEGSAFIITEHVIETKNLIWHQFDDTSLMLYGNLGDVSGVELIQDDMAIGRVAITSTEHPHRWMVDLSDKPSGHYAIRLLHGYSLLEEQPFILGDQSLKGSRIDKVTTNLSQATHYYHETSDVVVTSTWNNIPPQVNTLYHELSVINATSPPESTLFATYEMQPVNLPVNPTDGRTQSTLHTNIISSWVSAWRISTTISSNRLYAIDANNKQWTVAKITNDNITPSYLYVQPGVGLPQVDALLDCSGKIIALNPWINHSSRCDASFSNNNTAYNLISLKTSKPAPSLLGEIIIHTANTQSKQLLVREIALTKTMVSKIQTNWDKGHLPGYIARHALHFNWSLPNFLSQSTVKAHFQLHFNSSMLKDAYGEYYNFEYDLGTSHQTPYNGHLIPYAYPVEFSNFNLNHLTLHVKYNEDWIPILHSTPFTTDSTVNTKLFDMEMQVTCKALYGYETQTLSSSHYQEADAAHFKDTYTLLFYPLPEKMDEKSIQLEYWDTSLATPDWRPLNHAKYTGHALAVPANAIQPGNYTYRLKAKDLNAQCIDFSMLTASSQDGWAQGNFTVAHGGVQTAITHSQGEREVIRPIRKQTCDRWKNVISSTTASGNTTLFDYNERNQPIKQTQPAIEITGEDGNKKTLSPVTYPIYDKNDKTIAVRDANGHTLYHQRDNDGKTLKTTNADGVFKRFIPDIFGRTQKIRDPLDHDITYKHDRCNREFLRTDACNWETAFTYNELNDRLSTMNGNKEVERNDYLSPLNLPTHHYLPAGDDYLTIKEHDRHGVLIKEELADHRKNTWDVDDFGNVSAHTDLGGAKFTHTRNPFYPTEVVQTKSEGGKHGLRMDMDGSPKPMDDQNLEYQFDEASHTISILDNALSTNTSTRFDIEQRPARETFIGSDGHIHQAVLMQWNPLDWLTQVQDTVVRVNFSHDAVGNHRSSIASIYWNNAWSAVKRENWYTYTNANNIAINRGSLLNGIIQITPEQGSRILYDVAGRREHELTMKPDGSQLDKTLLYHPNNLLEQTKNTDNEVSLYFYDDKVDRRKTFSNIKTKHLTDFTKNGWIEKEQYVDAIQNVNSITSYALNLNGLPTHQSTSVRTLDGKDGYNDSIDTAYVQFDTDKITNVHGIRQRVNGGTSQSDIKVGYDPNSFTEVIIGDNQDPRHFLNNSKGLIIKKTLGQEKEENNIYTTSNQPVARFGNIPAQLLKGELTHVELDLNYHPTSDHFPPPAPSQCLVMENDTFESISERMYGDSSFADLIADVNGYSSEDTPPKGLTLQIPSSVNTNIHNWEGLYPAYNPSAIIGSIYPNMPLPQRPAQYMGYRQHHHHFWHVLVEALVGAVIMAFAPELAVMFSSVLPGIIGQALGFAIAGAVSNLAQQEIAIGFGDQDSLSLKSIGQSALLAAGTAGLAKGIGMDLTKASEFRGLQAAVKNVELTIATQGLSFLTGQQRHFEWRIMLGSIVSSLANVGVKQFDLGVPLFNDALATASGTVASISVDKIFNSEMNFEAIAANTLGTFLGNQLASQAKQYYADYKIKQQIELENKKSQIPEIRQSLEQSERQFIQEIIAHPHDHGLPSTEQDRPTGSGIRTNATNSPKPVRNKAVNNSPPPQEHLIKERAREEAQMCYSAQRNRNTLPSPSQKSRYGFWDAVDTIIDVGDTVADMLNPVKQIKNTWEDANESVRSFRNGDISHGMVSTGKTVLDLLYFYPVEKLAAPAIEYGSKGVSAVGSKLGFFGGKGTERLSTSTNHVPLKSINELGPIDANLANLDYTSRGYFAPYAVNSRPRNINTASDRTFVRVHGDDNQISKWMMRANEVDGLTPIQIKEKFALEFVPKKMTEVNVSAGTNMRVSIAGPQPQWGTSGGGTQYELLQRISALSFKPSIPIYQRLAEPNYYAEPYQNWSSIMTRR